jgi:PAS domain S-box-containing protein
MDDAYENRCRSEGEMLLRRRVTELERANEQLQERLTILEQERDRLQAERVQVLSGREQMFRATLDAITETLVVLDPRGVIQAVNQTAANRLGYRAEDLVGRDGRDLASGTLPPEVGDARLACLEEVVRTGKPLRVVDKRAGMVFDQMYYPVVDGEGHVTQVVVFAQDITTRARIEKELVESRQRYQDLLDNVNDIIYTADREGNLLTVNQAARRVMGFDPQEVVGTHYSRWIHEESRGRLEQARALALNGQRMTVELVIPAGDGSERSVELSLGPLLLDGRIVGTQGVIRDITERWKAERTIRENEEMLRALFNAVTESVIMLDCDGTMLMLNETAAKRLGKSVHELVGLRMADLGDNGYPPAVTERRMEKVGECVTLLHQHVPHSRS